MGLIIGQGGTKSGGGGGASSADKALANIGTLYGSVHNLFKVADDLRKDSIYGQYVGIMLFALDKGYATISLKGASAYVTSDGSYYNTTTATHQWHDGNDGYLDRWVAYLFASSTQDFKLTSDVLPKKILLDGQINNLSFQNYATQITEILCTEGSSFGDIYITNSSVQQWNKFLNIGKIRDHKTSSHLNLNGAKYVRYDIIKNSGSAISDTGNTVIGIDFPSLESASATLGSNYGGWTALRTIFFPKLENASTLFLNSNTSQPPTAFNVQTIVCPSLTKLTSSKLCNTIGIGYASLIHFEIGQGFDSEFNLSNASFANCLLTDSNDLVEDVVAHPNWSNLDQWLWNFEHLIVDKLADLSGQTAKTITLAPEPYAAITDNIKAKMTAKNWNLASA